MNEDNIVIVVGRQLGSGGRDIAKMLANDFNCKFCDRELLNLAAKESGFSEKFFEQYDEHKCFLRSVFHLHVPHVSEGNFYNDNLSEESLFKFQSDAIRKVADESSCVFVGRCSDYVLREKKNLVNIFISADAESRLNRICERHQCDRNAALKIINNGDSNRASYYNYYTGKKWGAAESYDLCINSSILGIEETEKYIKEFIYKKLNLK
ncbi:MAG: cytidylate kinase-like family protein [Bacteroidaceae bacterium]|nr:cytidylate kinase-like family protein [Bacteroidaceae bacterium]